MLKQIKDVWRLIPKLRRVHLFFVVTLQLSATLLEIATIGIIYMYLNVALGNEIQDVMPQWLLTLTKDYGVEDPAYFLACSGFILFLTRTLIALCAVFSTELFRQEMFRHLSKTLMRGYLKANYRKHLEKDSGQLLNNVSTNVTNVVAYCVIGLLEMTISLVVLSVYYSGMLYANAQLALSALGVFLILSFFYFAIMRKRLAAWGELTRTTSAKLYSEVNEIFSTFKTIKAFSVETGFFDRFENSIYRLTSLIMKVNVMREMPRLSFELIGVGGVLFGMLVAMSIDISGQVLISVVAAFGLIFLRALPHFVKLVSFAQYFNLGIPLMKAIIVDLDDFDRDTIENNKTGKKNEIPAKWDLIHVSNLHFSYNMNKKTLNNINIDIDKGSLVGFVGASGSGKSTTADIILGLLVPDEGSVDLMPQGNRMIDYDQMCAYVPQESMILNESIEKNISLCFDADSINQEKIHNVILASGLEKVVARLPDGPKSIIGESGKGLSIGEKQRLGIARALYRDAEVIILDEPTSSQDATHEAEIMDIIQGLKGSKTVITIAHRLNSLRKFDEIYMFENGRIIANGTFPELAANNDDFKKMLSHFTD